MNRDAAMDRLADILVAIVRGLVDDEAGVSVRVEEGEGHTRLRVMVAPKDFGKVLGRGGRTVASIRSILNAVGIKFRLPTCVNAEGEYHVCAHVYVEDPNPDRRGRGKF